MRCCELKKTDPRNTITVFSRATAPLGGDGTRDGFERIVEGFGSKHKRIPVSAWSYNSDVEMVHRTIEDEFYDLENFEGIKDFHQRVASYQAWYNIVRVNSNKDYKSPRQIIRELNPKMDIELVRLPPLMLDWLGPDYMTRDELSLKGVRCTLLSIYSDSNGQGAAMREIAKRSSFRRKGFV